MTGTIFLFIISNAQDKIRENVNDSPYPLASTYLELINKTGERIKEIGGQKIQDPQNELEYNKNDSLMHLEGIALDNFIQALVVSYGNVPTDSIFVKVKSYGGYIPPALVEKLKESDWSTPIGRTTKIGHDQFLNYYEQFDSLIGLSLCDTSITLKSAENTEEDLCELVSNGTFLIDVWASWCSPCRRFNKNHKKNYLYFKNNGIETISISVDKDEKKYKLASTNDNVPWPDFHDTNEELSSILNIKSLPFQFLVKDGEIIKIVFVGALENQLNEYILSTSK